jgi:hypothetical protein
MPSFVATVGYVRSLNIGSLSVWCEAKREGGFGCNHQADIDLASYPDEMPCGASPRLGPSASPIRVKTKGLKRAIGENDRIAFALLSEANDALRDDLVDYGRTPVSVM